MKASNLFLLLIFATTSNSLLAQQKKSFEDNLTAFENTICVDNKKAQESYNQLKSTINTASKDAVGNFYSTVGRYKYCLGELDSSIYFFKQSSSAHDLNGDPKTAGRMINNVAAVFEISSQLDSSLIYYDSALFFAKKTHDSAVMSAVLSGKGIILEMKGQLTEALGSYQKAEQIQKKNIDALLTARLNRYAILVNHFPDQMNYDELYSSYKLAKINKLDQQQASLLQFVADHKRLIKEYDSANYFYDLGIKISSSSGRPDLTAFMLDGKARTSLDQSMTEFAIQLLDSARLMCESYELNNPLIQVYTSLSEAYLIDKQIQNSIDAGQKAINLSELYGQKEVVTKAYQVLAKAYSLTGNYENAFAYQQKFTEKSEEILDHQKSEQLTFLQTKYETDKITNQRNLAEERATVAEVKSRQNLTLFIAALIVALLIIISAIFYFSKLKQAKKAEMVALQLRESQRRLALEKQYRDSELKALKAQMNPHFIFNVLNSIQEFIILNQKDLASDYLAMFADLIRGYLHYSSLGHIPLADEIESISQYLELEKLRFGESMSFEVNYETQLNTEAIKIPTMIIQPYVENAIKHGLFSKKGDKKLTVDFRTSNEETIICTITDNGIGRTKARELKENSLSKYKSFATEANASRLELFNQMTSKQIGVETIDLTDEHGNTAGTQVIITIPTIKE